MNLSELRERVAKLVSYESDTTEGTDPSGSSLDEAINWGQDYLSKRLYLYSANVTFTTSGGVNVYDVQDSSFFSRRMLDVDRVIINGVCLRNAEGKQGVYSATQFDGWFPTWRTAGTGVVQAASYSHPFLTVSSAATGAIPSCFVCGQFMAASLSSSGDVSELPEETHELICYLAAYYIQAPIVDTEEAWKRVLQFRQDAEDSLNQIYVRQYVQVHGMSPGGMKNDA